MNDTQFILENKNHIDTEKEELLDFVSPFNRKTRNFNSQTEVDMLMMNKLCKKYDLLPVQIFNVTENIENGNFHKNDIVSQNNNINKIESVDNNDVINMIPIEELPIDISLADSELCTEACDFIEQQINVVNEAALNSILPAHSEFYDISFVKGKELNIGKASGKENNSFDINLGNIEYQNKDLLIETVETRKPYPYEKEEVSSGYLEESEEYLLETSHNAEEQQPNTFYDSEKPSSEICPNEQELCKRTISLNSEELESDTYPKSVKLDSKISSIKATDIQIRDEIKESNCQSLKPAQIIEFDRSDISSDSETDDKKTRKISRRRNRGSPKISQVEDRENLENVENSIEHSSEESNFGGTKRKRRRHGVSAEPVRVSWSEMRELYKKVQVRNIEERHDVIGNVADVGKKKKQSVEVSEVTVGNFSKRWLFQKNV